MKQASAHMARLTLAIAPAQRDALVAEAGRKTLEQRRPVSVSEVARAVLERGFQAQQQEQGAA
jgi:hypothetical protein